MSEPDAAYKPIVAHNREENYRQFELLHGFDIRGSLTQVHSRVTDTRDKRDPTVVGQALLSRPQNVSILEMADLINELT